MVRGKAGRGSTVITVGGAQRDACFAENDLFLERKRCPGPSNAPGQLYLPPFAQRLGQGPRGAAHGLCPLLARRG